MANLDHMTEADRAALEASRQAHYDRFEEEKAVLRYQQQQEWLQDNKDWAKHEADLRKQNFDRLQKEVAQHGVVYDREDV